MYSKFFGNRKITLGTGMVNQRYVNQGSIITDLAYSPNEFVKERLDYLADNKAQLSKQLRKAEDQVEALRQELSTNCLEEQELKEPSRRFERSKMETDRIKDIIITKIYQSLLDGKTNTRFLAPDDYDGAHNYYIEKNHSTYSEFFNSILKTYGANLKVTSFNGIEDTYFYWSIDFPEQFCKTSLPLQEGNTKYNELLLSFDKHMSSVYKDAETKTCFLFLKENLKDSEANENLHTNPRF